MATLSERIIGAALLDTKIYEEVEADQSATTQAMLVVIASAAALGLASIRMGPSAVVASVVLGLIGWAVWAGLTFVIGTKVMPEPTTHADFGQMLRVLGFAAAPGILGVLGIIPLLGWIIAFAVSIWQLIAFVIAVRQGLDYSSTGRAVIVCLIGWVAYWIFAVILGTMVGGAAMLGGALSR
jgi:hypothetical protein